jgi:ComF family protein
MPAMMRIVIAAANTIIRTFLEPACAACGAPLDAPLARAICDRCWGSWVPVGEPSCPRCGDRLEPLSLPGDDCEHCRTYPPAFSVARSVGLHDGALREIVHAFKYERRRLLAEPLGGLLREVGREVLDDAYAVVPVPLHPVRSVQRGFNQADDLARELRRPVWRVLRRRRFGPSQTSLPATGRRRNLGRDFGLSLRALFDGSSRQRMAGARLVLVDDVMTTGATLDACARVLAAAGAADVRALTVTRAVAGRPPRRPAPPLPSALPHR